MSDLLFIATVVGLLLALGLSLYKNYSLKSVLDKSEAQRLDALSQVEDLKLRYKNNPSYDAQLAMADLLAGSGLFKIERVDRENLFFRRR